MPKELFTGSRYEDVIKEIEKEFQHFEVIDTNIHRKGFLKLKRSIEVWVDGQKKGEAEKTPTSATGLSAEQELIIKMLEETPQPKKTSEPNLQLEEMKKMIERLSKQVEVQSKKKEFLQEEGEELLHEYYQNLLQNEIEKNIVQRVMGAVRKELGVYDLENRKKIESVLLKKLESIVKTNGPLPKEVQTFCLVGPTGVGKTTTLAKLGGNFILQGESVGLITTDVYRIGATDQSQEYANILGCTMKIAKNPHELREAINYFKYGEKVDRILIDTMGRNPLGQELLSEVQEYIRIASPDHISLVLSATQKSADLNRILQNFHNLSINSIIFTKLDETVSIGALFNVSVKEEVPISYMTNGQKVPNDILVATPAGIAERLMQGVCAHGSSVFFA